jgi:hypothetical protein
LIIEELSLSRLEEFLEIVTKMVTEAEFSYAKLEKHKILQLYKNPNATAFLAIENNRFYSGLVA